MNYENILIEKENSIVILTINRPDKLNALNHKTLSEINSAFDEFENDENISAVIITGSGEKAFVAGADIKELNQLDEKTGIEFAEFGQNIFSKVENFNKPVIAAINGFALGGGCELALACHIRYASENSKFGQPEVNLGVIPGYGGTQRLARLINTGRAMEYILSGDMIDANEALRIGLVSKVFPKDELLTKAKELAAKISSKGLIAVKLAIKSVNALNKVSLEEGLKIEAELFGKCCATEDFKEGTKAFLEKRKAGFKNK